MHVRKRNGTQEPVDLNKIVNSIQRVCSDIHAEIDVYRIATKTVGGLVDGVSTRELDLLSVRNAVGLIGDDPIYSRVAARILAGLIAKEVGSQDIQSFSQSIETGYRVGLIGEATYTLVMKNKRKLNAAIRHERDWSFEYHGIQTLFDRYLLKHPTLMAADQDGKRQRVVIETPQYFFLRVACGLAETAIEAIEFYTLLSSLEYMASTPTLFNSGTVHSQMSSCYLNDSPLDSLDDIFKRYGDIALLSKYAGGIGVSASRIRGAGALIKGTNGKSNGIVPWLHTMSASVASVNQGGKRKGAACVYLETHHPDIMEFLELRDNTGEKEKRAYNLNLANWVPDLFMQRVKQDAMWSLFDPTVAPELTDLYGEAYTKRYLELEAEGKFASQLPATKVYARMMRTLAETGNGWMCFKDTANARANQVGGERVLHLSNLCVAPETMILTEQGYQPIATLREQSVKVWNGEEFSETTVRQTGVDQKLIRVAFDNGIDLDCTPYHKFHIVAGSRATGVREVRAADLRPGDRLIKHVLPTIDGAETFADAYTHGFFCGDGTYASGKPMACLYGVKKALVPELAIASGSHVPDASGRLNYRLVETLAAKFTVPTGQHTRQSRLDWLAGLLDADGTVARNGGNDSLQIGSVNSVFLNEVQLMLQTLGVQARVSPMRAAGQCQFRDSEPAYPTQPMYRLLISSTDTEHLRRIGLQCRRLVVRPQAPNRDARHFVRVVGVTDQGRTDDTYCFTEPKRHRGMFNGVLTGQCTEILEVTTSGKRRHLPRAEMLATSAAELMTRNLHVVGFDPAADAFEVIDGSETAVCNLGSINIGRGYIKNGRLDKEKLHRNVALAVKYLDRVIDRNFYPIHEAEASNHRWRPVGLGLMGLADFFMQLRVPYESPEAIRLSAEIQEEIYFQALTTSCELAQTLGAHRDFHLTRAAEGLLQFDLAGVTPVDTARWDKLRADIRTHGLRNSLVIALAPTATISHICGVEECIEPIKANLLKRETLSGEFISINRSLAADLKKLGRWDAETINQLKLDEGSIANIAGLPAEMYPLYRTVWEMSMKTIVAHAVARGAYIDQSQSVNFFINLNKYPRDKRIGVLSSLYMHAWEQGMKTTYYFRSRAASSIEKTTVSHVGSVMGSIVDSVVGATAAMQAPQAAENPEVCESCT